MNQKIVEAALTESREAMIAWAAVVRDLEKASSRVSQAVAKLDTLVTLLGGKP